MLRHLHNFPSYTIMNSDEMFNWPDGDVILRATHGANSRDFRVHKLFLSFASPVFKDMFKVPQPPSPSSNVDIIDVTDSPRTLELVLRFIYPFAPPVIKDLTTLSEVLIIADKYDIETVQSRLRPSLAELAKTKPLRAYAIACRLGFEDEMKIASSHMTAIDLSELTQLPDEFKFIPATEYHRLIRRHKKHRSGGVAAVASPLIGARLMNTPTTQKQGIPVVELFFVSLFFVLVCYAGEMFARR